MGMFSNDSGSTRDVQTRALLGENLGFDGFYWYPLHARPTPSVAEYFDADVFVKKFGIEKLIELIRQLGYIKLNLITETEEDEKVEIIEVEEYCGVEKVYCDEKVEWAIYFSHENTVTFVGARIINALKANWTDWEAYSDSWESS